MFIIFKKKEIDVVYIYVKYSKCKPKTAKFGSSSIRFARSKRNTTIIKNVWYTLIKQICFVSAKYGLQNDCYNISVLHVREYKIASLESKHCNQLKTLRKQFSHSVSVVTKEWTRQLLTYLFQLFRWLMHCKITRICILQ